MGILPSEKVSFYVDMLRYNRRRCAEREVQREKKRAAAVEKLDELLKSYVRRVMDGSEVMLTILSQDLESEQEDVGQTEESADRLAEILVELQAELKATKRQRIRDIMKHPEQEEVLEEIYDELEAPCSYAL